MAGSVMSNSSSKKSSSNPFSLMFLDFRDTLASQLLCFVRRGSADAKWTMKKWASALSLSYSTSHWEDFPYHWPFFCASLSQWLGVASLAADRTVGQLLDLVDGYGAGTRKSKWMADSIFSELCRKTTRTDLKRAGKNGDSAIVVLGNITLNLVVVALLERILRRHGCATLSPSTLDRLEHLCVNACNPFAEVPKCFEEKDSSVAVWSQLNDRLADCLAALRGCVSEIRITKFVATIQSPHFVANAGSHEKNHISLLLNACYLRFLLHREVDEAERTRGGALQSATLHRSDVNLDSNLKLLVGYLEFLLNSLANERDKLTQLAQLKALEGVFQQLDFTNESVTPASGLWGTLSLHAQRAYSTATKLSKSKDVKLKAAALRVAVTIIMRSNDKFFAAEAKEFMNKRILRHLDEPKKVKHCLQIVLIFLRGGCCRYDTSSTNTHMRPNMGDAGTKSKLMIEWLECINCALFGSKSARALGKIKPITRSGDPEFVETDLDLLVQVIVQMASHSLSFVTERTLPSLLANPRKSPHLCLVGLRAVNWLLDSKGFRCVWKATGSGDGKGDEPYDAIDEDEFGERRQSFVSRAKEVAAARAEAALLKMTKLVASKYVPNLLKVCATTVGVKITGYAVESLRFTPFRPDHALADRKSAKEIYAQQEARWAEFATIYRSKHIPKKSGGEGAAIALVEGCIQLFHFLGALHALHGARCAAEIRAVRRSITGARDGKSLTDQEFSSLKNLGLLLPCPDPEYLLHPQWEVAAAASHAMQRIVVTGRLEARLQVLEAIADVIEGLAVSSSVANTIAVQSLVSQLAKLTFSFGEALHAAARPNEDDFAEDERTPFTPTPLRRKKPTTGQSSTVKQLTKSKALNTSESSGWLHRLEGLALGILALPNRASRRGAVELLRAIDAVAWPETIIMERVVQQHAETIFARSTARARRWFFPRSQKNAPNQSKLQRQTSNYRMTTVETMKESSMNRVWDAAVGVLSFDSGGNLTVLETAADKQTIRGIDSEQLWRVCLIEVCAEVAAHLPPESLRRSRIHTLLHGWLTQLPQPAPTSASGGYTGGSQSREDFFQPVKFSKGGGHDGVIKRRRTLALFSSLSAMQYALSGNGGRIQKMSRSIVFGGMSGKGGGGGSNESKKIGETNEEYKNDFDAIFANGTPSASTDVSKRASCLTRCLCHTLGYTIVTAMSNGSNYMMNSVSLEDASNVSNQSGRLNLSPTSSGNTSTDDCSFDEMYEQLWRRSIRESIAVCHAGSMVSAIESLMSWCTLFSDKCEAEAAKSADMTTFLQAKKAPLPSRNCIKAEVLHILRLVSEGSEFATAMQTFVISSENLEGNSVAKIYRQLLLDRSRRIIDANAGALVANWLSGSESISAAYDFVIIIENLARSIGNARRLASLLRKKGKRDKDQKNFALWSIEDRHCVWTALRRLCSDSVYALKLVQTETDSKKRAQRSKATFMSSLKKGRSAADISVIRSRVAFAAAKLKDAVKLAASIFIYLGAVYDVDKVEIGITSEKKNMNYSSRSVMSPVAINASRSSMPPIHHKKPIIIRETKSMPRKTGRMSNEKMFRFIDDDIKWLVEMTVSAEMKGQRQVKVNQSYFGCYGDWVFEENGDEKMSTLAKYLLLHRPVSFRAGVQRLYEMLSTQSTSSGIARAQSNTQRSIEVLFVAICESYVAGFLSEGLDKEDVVHDEKIGSDEWIRMLYLGLLCVGPASPLVMRRSAWKLLKAIAPNKKTYSDKFMKQQGINRGDSDGNGKQRSDEHSREISSFSSFASAKSRDSVQSLPYIPLVITSPKTNGKDGVGTSSNFCMDVTSRQLARLEIGIGSLSMDLVESSALELAGSVSLGYISATENILREAFSRWPLLHGELQQWGFKLTLPFCAQTFQRSEEMNASTVVSDVACESSNENCAPDSNEKVASDALGSRNKDSLITGNTLFENQLKGIIQDAKREEAKLSLFGKTIDEENESSYDGGTFIVKSPKNTSDDTKASNSLYGDGYVPDEEIDTGTFVVMNDSKETMTNSPPIKQENVELTVNKTLEPPTLPARGKLNDNSGMKTEKNAARKLPPRPRRPTSPKIRKRGTLQPPPPPPPLPVRSQTAQKVSNPPSLPGRVVQRPKSFETFGRDGTNTNDKADVVMDDEQESVETSSEEDLVPLFGQDDVFGETSKESVISEQPVGEDETLDSSKQVETAKKLAEHAPPMSPTSRTRLRLEGAPSTLSNGYLKASLDMSRSVSIDSECDQKGKALQNDTSQDNGDELLHALWFVTCQIVRISDMSGNDDLIVGSGITINAELLRVWAVLSTNLQGVDWIFKRANLEADREGEGKPSHRLAMLLLCDISCAIFAQTISLPRTPSSNKPFHDLFHLFIEPLAAPLKVSDLMKHNQNDLPVGISPALMQMLGHLSSQSEGRALLWDKPREQRRRRAAAAALSDILSGQPFALQSELPALLTSCMLLMDGGPLGRLLKVITAALIIRAPETMRIDAEIALSFFQKASSPVSHSRQIDISHQEDSYLCKTPSFWRMLPEIVPVLCRLLDARARQSLRRKQSGDEKDKKRSDALELIGGSTRWYKEAWDWTVAAISVSSLRLPVLRLLSAFPSEMLLYDFRIPEKRWVPLRVKSLTLLHLIISALPQALGVKVDTVENGDEINSKTVLESTNLVIKGLEELIRLVDAAISCARDSGHILQLPEIGAALWATFCLLETSSRKIVSSTRILLLKMLGNLGSGPSTSVHFGGHARKDEEEQQKWGSDWENSFRGLHAMCLQRIVKITEVASNAALGEAALLVQRMRQIKRKAQVSGASGVEAAAAVAAAVATYGDSCTNEDAQLDVKLLLRVSEIDDPAWLVGGTAMALGNDERRMLTALMLIPLLHVLESHAATSLPVTRLSQQLTTLFRPVASSNVNNKDIGRSGNGHWSAGLQAAGDAFARFTRLAEDGGKSSSGSSQSRAMATLEASLCETVVREFPELVPHALRGLSYFVEDAIKTGCDSVVSSTSIRSTLSLARQLMDHFTSTKEGDIERRPNAKIRSSASYFLRQAALLLVGSQEEEPSRSTLAVRRSAKSILCSDVLSLAAEHKGFEKKSENEYDWDSQWKSTPKLLTPDEVVKNFQHVVRFEASQLRNIFREAGYSFSSPMKSGDGSDDIYTLKTDTLSMGRHVDEQGTTTPDGSSSSRSSPVDRTNANIDVKGVKEDIVDDGEKNYVNQLLHSTLQVSSSTIKSKVTLAKLIRDEPHGLRNFLESFISDHATFEQTDLDFFSAVQSFQMECNRPSFEDAGVILLNALEGAEEIVSQFVDLDSFDTIEIAPSIRDTILTCLELAQDQSSACTDDDEKLQVVDKLLALFDDACTVVEGRLGGDIFDEFCASPVMADAEDFITSKESK
eukprot:g5339.t1